MCIYREQRVTLVIPRSRDVTLWIILHRASSISATAPLLGKSTTMIYDVSGNFLAWLIDADSSTWHSSRQMLAPIARLFCRVCMWPLHLDLHSKFFFFLPCYRGNILFEENYKFDIREFNIPDELDSWHANARSRGLSVMNFHGSRVLYS